jgi:hypothetical protein
MSKQKRNEPESIFDIEVSLKELVGIIKNTHLTWSGRRIQQKVIEDGYPKGKVRNHYPVVNFLLKIIEEENNKKQTGGKNTFAEKRDEIKFLREQFEFKRDVIGSAISVDDHQARLEKIVVHINTKLEIIPSKAAVKFDLPQHVKKGLKELVDEIKNELSDYDTYRLRLENNSGSVVKSGRGGKKNTKTVHSKSKTKTKRVGK